MNFSEQVLHAEILQALHVVECNHSFASSNGDSERFQIMFPDSNIAKSYSQAETKTKYIIQYGIYPYVKDELIKDVNGCPITFRFDETTTSQIKKQYGYLSYFSDIENRLVTSYSDSLFLGHCTAKHLVSHFYEFMEKMKVDTQLLLNLGMDGSSVNLSFARELNIELSKKSSSFLSTGSCPLHTVNNAFGKGMAALSNVINLDQFAIDIHFFFKLSSARREDLNNVSSITGVTIEYAIRHS